MDFVTIHCSHLPHWTRCEKGQLDLLVNPPAAVEAPEHVAAWIGKAVHAVVAGEPAPLMPRMLVFDKVTPTPRFAHRQVEVMAHAVNGVLEGSGWTMLGQEIQLEPYASLDWIPELRLVGRPDLLALDAGSTVLADIKTSREFIGAWLQMGGYGLCASDLPDLTTFATIHCPRPEKLIDTIIKAEIHTRPAKPIMVEAERVMQRISDLLHNEDLAVASPSRDRCGYCSHPDCPVRSHDFVQRGQ